MQPLGRMLIVLGLVIVGAGIALMFSDKIPFLGKLPGDIHIRRENFQFLLPITSSIVISVLFSVVLWVFSHFKGK